MAWVRRIRVFSPRRYGFVVMPNHIHGIIVIDGAVGAPLVGTLDDDHAGIAGAERATTRVAPTEATR